MLFAGGEPAPREERQTLLEETAKAPMQRRGLWRLAAILLVAVPIAAGAAWFLWPGGDDTANREVVVFQADPSPYRVAPDVADESDVPNTGILVLETTSSDEGTVEHEVLMPPPEQPFVLDSGDQETTDVVVDVAEAPLKPVNEEVESEPIFDADQVTVMVDEALDEMPSAVPPLPDRKPAAPDVDWGPQTVESADSTSATSLSFSDVAASLGEEIGGESQTGSGARYGIRVASYSSEELATGAWDRLHREHNDLFGDLEATIIMISLGDREFFRLVIGEFEARQEAEGLCELVVERALDCRVMTY